MTKAQSHLAEAAEAFRKGRLDKAEGLCRRVLKKAPGEPDALHLMALIAGERGRYRRAADLLRKAIATADDRPALWLALGSMLGGGGDAGEAEAAYRRAIDLNPAFVEAYANLGALKRRQGDEEGALAAYRQGLAAVPDSPVLHFNMGNLLLARGAFGEAEACYRAVLARDPGQLGARNNLAMALSRQGKLDEALAEHRAVLDKAPEHVDSWINTGNIHWKRERLSAAEDCYRRALQLAPDDVSALVGMGHIRADQGELDGARALYERALQLAPQSADARWGLALVLLAGGDLAEGFAAYEARWGMRDFAARPRHEALAREGRPRWDGAPVAGRTVLVWAEQGFGDSIQFIRYAPLLARAGARVVVEAPLALHGLLRGVEGVAALVDRDAPADERLDYDLQIPMMSLPHAFSTTLESVPAEVPYIHVDGALPDAVEAWLKQDRDRKLLTVGIAWAGSPKNRRDAARSVPVAALAPLFALDGVRFYSLQKGPGSEAIEPWSRDAGAVRNAGPLLDNGAPSERFLDTARLMNRLDLVISADTATAHLAGALGRRTWTMLAAAPDWRWMLGRDDSPWYPTMRLYRQGEPGDWAGVVAAMGEDLRRLAER